MTPERWKLVKAIVQAALELPAGERPQFLDEACARDEVLRGQVDSLLTFHTSGSTPSPPTVTNDPAVVPIPAPNPAVLVGQTLSHYAILEVMGRGGMGIVYRARDLKLSRPVAVKVLPAELSSDADRLRRFEQEARAASALNHPNIVTIHDVGQHESSPYMVMELVDGKTLRDSLGLELDLRRILDLACQLVDGVAKAHDAGIVHRDLKPENIMITNDGFVKILDFGLAKLLPQRESLSHSTTTAMLTRAGVVMGTLGYMSPEQVTQKPIDHRSDQFALGSILYEVLTGRLAFYKETPVQTLSSIIESEPEPIERVNPEVPWGVKIAVERCLRKNAADRYASTRELLSELQQARDEIVQTAVRKRAKGPWVRVHPARRKRAMLLAGVTLPVIMGVAVFIWFWVVRRHTPPQPMSVLVADFQNDTGDAELHDVLEPGLGLALGEASFITSFSREAARAISEQLRPGSSLDVGMARLISRREGINVILTGKIATRGSGYQIVVDAVDPGVEPGEGEALATATEFVAKRAQLLQAIAPLAADLRRDLGDTTPRSLIEGQAETFTAASLEAMMAYVRGQQLFYQRDVEGALKAYQEAVSRDPRLGRAHAGMGAIYANLGQLDKAQASYQAALRTLDRMTEREKHRTLGGYYLGVARNFEKAIENFEELVTLYPADDAGHTNLALAYLYTRRIGKAVEEGRKATEIYPNNSFLRANYAMYLMYAGAFGHAIEQAERVLAMTQDELMVMTVALSRLGTGDANASREAYERLQGLGPSGVSLATMGKADLALYFGRPQEAVALLEAGIASDRTGGYTANEAHKRVALAEAFLALGLRQRAREAARGAIELNRQESILFPAARVLIAAGATEEASVLADTLREQLQSQTQSYARLIHGSIAGVEKRFPDAMDAFRDGLQRQNSWFARYLLGLAYLEAGHPAEALSELELCVERKGEVTDVFIDNSPTMRYLPPVYYELARSQEALGARDNARVNFERYLEIRRDAVPPDPLVDDVKARLERLTGS
jgi:tetratricopeptide (TPR) repeat protein